MSEFFAFLKIIVICGTVFFVVMTVLLAMPQSRLRSVGLEMSKWALACGLLVLLPSPVDIAPDGIPLIGWLDDAGYLLAAGCAIRGALKDRERRGMLEDLEFEQAVSEARKKSKSSAQEVEKEVA